MSAVRPRSLGRPRLGVDTLIHGPAALGRAQGGAINLPPACALPPTLAPTPLLQLEEALAGDGGVMQQGCDEDGGEGHDSEESEEELEEEEERRPNKRARTRMAAPVRRRLTADDVSTLLAGAPAFVDALLQEDSVRCITLVCRDVVNLSLAFGGGVELSPVWQTLADRIRCVGDGRGALVELTSAGRESPSHNVVTSPKVCRDALRSLLELLAAGCWLQDEGCRCRGRGGGCGCGWRSCRGTRCCT